MDEFRKIPLNFHYFNSFKGHLTTVHTVVLCSGYNFNTFQFNPIF